MYSHSTPVRSVFVNMLAFRVFAVVIGALVVLATVELSANRRSGGSVRQSRNVTHTWGANRSNNLQPQRQPEHHQRERQPKREREPRRWLWPGRRGCG